MGEGNKPDYNCTIAVGKEDKKAWINIGAGWMKEKGISVQLNALPPDGQFFMFPYKERKKE